MHSHMTASESNSVGKHGLIQTGFDWDVLGFDSSTHENTRKHISSPLKYDAEITSKPYDDSDFLLQLVAHENLLKSFFLQLDINPKLERLDRWRFSFFGKIDFYLERMMKYKVPGEAGRLLDKIARKDISWFLKTSVLKPVLPSIPSKYGSDLPLKMVLSMNTDIFKEGVPDAPLMGVDFGKDGTISIHLNLHIDLLVVDKSNIAKSIRHFYIPLEIKLKEAEPIKFDPVSEQFNVSIHFVDISLKGMKVYSLNPVKLE